MRPYVSGVYEAPAAAGSIAAVLGGRMRCPPSNASFTVWPSYGRRHVQRRTASGYTLSGVSLLSDKALLQRNFRRFRVPCTYPCEKGGLNFWVIYSNRALSG
jgi:hypothetical protein